MTKEKLLNNIQKTKSKTKPKIGENKWQDWLGLIYPVTKEWL